MGWTSRTNEVRGRHLGGGVYLGCQEDTKKGKWEGILSSGLFQFQAHHPWASYDRWLGRPRRLKRPIRNSDKDASLGIVMVGILKLLWLWKPKTWPSTRSQWVRKAAWETRLINLIIAFFPLDTCGQIQVCLQKWISKHRDKNPYMDINMCG